MEWTDLNSKWKGVRQQGMEKGTWAAVYSSAEKYIAFANRFSFPAFPIETTRICVYATHLAVLGRVAGTIKNTLSHISIYSQLMGNAPLNFQNIFVKLTLKGLKRSAKTRESCRSGAITPQMLRLMEPHVDRSHSVQVTAWAAILTAFNMLLRKSNLVPNSATNFRADQQLQRRDIIFFKHMALVNIKWSKTRQDGNRVTMPLLKGIGKLDPIKAIKDMLRLTPNTTKRDPLFLYKRQNKSSHTPYDTDNKYSVLTYETVTSYLKQWLDQAGFKGRRFTMHGLRRGGATNAYNMRIPEHAIQLLGDWRSDAYKNYLEEDLSKRIATAADLNAIGCI